MPTPNRDWSGFYANVNAAALGRYPELLFQWFPAGQLAGKEFEVGNINGLAGRSFKVNVERGVWADFATGEGGSDPISLYAALNHLKQGDAGMALGRELGLEPPRLKRAPDSAWKPVTPIPDGLTPQALPHGRPAGVVGPAWLYFDAEGRPLMYRVRFDQEGGGKEVLPLTWCQNAESGETAWRWKDLPAPRPLYNVEKLVARPEAPVLIVEGEPCVDAAEALLPEFVVITWAGGAKRAGRKDTDWRPLVAGLARTPIYIWPDNDDPGKTAALTIAEILAAAKPLIVRPDPTWPEGHDIADLAKVGWNTARVLEHLKTAVPAAGEALKLKRIPVDISINDLDTQTQAIWEAVTICNVPPTLFDSPRGLVVVDRDLFGRARQRIADAGLLRNWLVSRLAFYTVMAGGHQKSTHPTDALLLNLLVGRNKLPILNRMTEIPIFTIGGRLIAREGFDEESGVYYLPLPSLNGLKAIEGTPTPTQLMAALNVFEDLVCDFPFVEDCDFTHALAFALIPLIRLTIQGRTPLFRFEAPSPGTGKSILMKMLSDIGCTKSSGISPTTEDEEWRKRITAALMGNPDAILIDNAQKLESAHLKKLLTDDYWEDRPLNQSAEVRFEVRALFGVSLNNPLLSREMIRRSLRIRLDARQERPEARSGWRHPFIEEYAREHRSELVAALITIAQYGLTHAEIDDDLPTLGSYEAFSRKMGAIMKVIDKQGFLGDRQDDSMLSNDEVSASLFIQKWGEKSDLLEQGFSVRELIPLAEEIDGFYLGDGKTERGKQTYLGMWLSKRRGMVFGNWQIMDPKKTPTATIWRLKRC